MTGIQHLALLIESLESADRPELVERWRRDVRSMPPKGVSKRFLIAGIAHRHQMKAHGRSTSRLQHRIERANRKEGDKTQSAKAPSTLAPGARLIREWNGSNHTVDVTEDGFVLDGVQYRSLSAIARTITGTRWSGPRFFGLKPEKTS